ncbi:MAG: serine/threonine-protein kinase [Verrucomicrobiales bacterium]|nr:serine/threonine-protein kinase [Verrucomicrobiales bacterium]
MALSTAARGLVIRYFGDYEIIEELARGGMGVVFRAEQRSLKRAVALKLLNAGSLASLELVQRFKTEAEAASALDHPNIVRILEIGEHEGQHFFSMELIRGPSLATHLAGGPLEQREAARILIKVAKALHHAHQRGVLHRDVKPSNVLLDANDEPHLADFGIARIAERESELTVTGDVLGAPAYMSPEQARGTKDVTTATDVYGLGAVLYQCLTGVPPFAGASRVQTIRLVVESEPRAPSRLNSAVSRDIETICLKCLAKEPFRRYASALAVAEDLERYLGNRPIKARPVGTAERLRKWVQRRPAQAALFITGGLVIVTAAAAVFWLRTARIKERENRAHMSLGLASGSRTTGNPKGMLWSTNAMARLAEARILSDKPYYRDQVAATFEGSDAVQLAYRRALLNHQIAFLPSDDALFLAGTAGGEVWRFSGRGTTNSLSASFYPGKPIAFPAGALLQIIQSDSGKLLAWHGLDRRTICELEMPKDLSLAALAADSAMSALMPDHSTLFLMFRDSTGEYNLVLWKLPSGRIARIEKVGRDITALAVSDDGSVAAIASGSEGHVKVWDISRGDVMQQFSISGLPTSSLAFARSVRRNAGRARNPLSALVLAVGDVGGTIGIWDVEARRLQAACRAGNHQILSLAFSPDRMTLASGGRGTVRLWDVTTGTPLLDLAGDYCGALAFNDDGRLLAASAKHEDPNRQIFVWQLQNGRGISTFRGLSSGVTRIAFSPRSDRLVAVGMGWEVGVWDVELGALLHIVEAPRGFSADNFGLAFSPDSRLLALSAGTQAQLWDISSGQLVQAWALPPGLGDTFAFPDTNSLFLMRVETLQGTEAPMSNYSSKIHPRVCRLRNLMSPEFLTPIREITDFNLGTFDICASADGRSFVIEGIGSSGNQGRRLLLAVDAASGHTNWQKVSTNRANWGNVHLSSRGTRLAFTTNGGTWSQLDLGTPSEELVRLPCRPAAVGPDGLMWAALGEVAGFGRGLTVFEGGTSLFNLGFDFEVFQSPRFDGTGRLLAWGNTDGRVILCDLEEIKRGLKEFGVAYAGSKRDLRE